MPTIESTESPLRLSINIVRALKEYGEVPIEFLSVLLGRSTRELNEYLDTLREEHVVETHGSNIRLVEARPK